MATRLPSDLTFPSLHAKYVVYNFHRLAELERMTALLSDVTDSRPRVAILQGERGSGRQYFVEAACYRTTQAGILTRHATVNLDGYEPGQSSLEHFVNHQIAKHVTVSRSRATWVLEHLKGKLDFKTPTVWGVIFPAIALQLELPFKDLASLLDGAADVVSGPRRSEAASLSRLFDQLTEQGKFVFHLADSIQLPDTLWGWLIDAARRNPRLILAFACAPGDPRDQMPHRVSAVRFDFTPLAPNEIRDLLTLHFQPNSFPDSLYDALWRYSHGVSARLTVIIADLVANDVLQEDSVGGWQMADGGLTSEECVRQFTDDLYEPLSALLHQLPAENYDHVQQFLWLAALCGENIPVKALLACLDVGEGEQDTLIDLLEKHLLEGTALSFFHDHEYHHPSFPGHLIYAFLNPLLPKILLDRLSRGERAYWAARLLRVLQVEIPERTRGSMRLFREVSTFLDTPEEQQEYERELAWWIGVEEAEDLARLLVGRLSEGSLDPVVLWNAVRGSERTWPAYKRLAVLNAYAQQPAGVPFAQLGAFHALRSSLFYDTGQYGEAITEATAGLTVCEKSSLREAGLLTMSGLAHLELAQFDGAIRHLRHALAIYEKVLRPEHPDVARSLDNLAGLYHAQGQYAQAEPLYQRSLAIREKVLGPEHPDVARSLNNLAELYRTQGQYAQAEPLYQRSLAILEKVLGPEHPDVATSLSNLAELYRTQGQYAQAEPLYQRSLAILEKVLGPEHPGVARSLNNLAALYHTQGQYAKAEPLLQRALTIWEKVLGPEHPNVATSLSNLAALYHTQGQYAKAEPLLQRSLAILEKVLGPEHPDVARSLNNLGRLYYAQGQYAQAEPLLQRALTIWEKVLGPEHLNVATSLSNLAELYRAQGQYAQAEPLYQHSLAIREKVLGPEHPDVATSLENYAVLLRELDRVGEATPVEAHSKKIRDKR